MSAKTASTKPTRNKHCSNEEPGIDITREEFDRIRDALKKEEFRKLFCDYIEEIQDPENRKIYEAEIKQFEKERGVNVKFINPEPGFVVKTSVDGAQKCFINIAKCKEIEKPSSLASCNAETGVRGLNWSIPLAQAAPRDDIDNQKKRCRVYDVVFHPDALHLANRDARFRKLLIDTALDAVEREFKVSLDRTNLKFPKLQFKGIARPTVIRTLAKNATSEETEPHPLEHIFPAKPTADAGKPKILSHKNEQHEQPKFSVPKFQFKYRRDVDLAEYTNELDAKLNLTLPRELIVEIELPLLRTTADCQLDVTEKTVYLLSEVKGAKYRLNIDLPYAVNDKEGSAKFDTDTRCLRITLPVLQPTAEKQRTMHESLLQREDSGVECTASGDELHSPNSVSPIEELSDIGEELNEVASVQDIDNGNTNNSPSTKSVVASANFLKSSIHYQFPAKFDCNVLDNVLSLVLHVRNVQNESIATIQHAKSLHLQFISIGSGYYPTHYAFYIQLPEDIDVHINQIDAEAWENNVVLNVSLNTPGELLHSYLAGLDKNDLKEYSIQGQFHVKSSPRSIRSKKPITPPISLSSSLDVSVERSECERSVEIEIKPHLEHMSSSSAGAVNTTEDEEMTTNASEQREQATKKLNKKQKKRNKKRRSYSESTYDDIKVLEQQNQRVEEQKNNKATTTATATASVAANGETQITVHNPANATTAIEMPLTQQQRKQRSYSECRDSFSATNTLTFKSILKRYSRYDPRPSISDSCSSFDDYSASLCSSMDGGVASSLHFSQSFCGIPEENSTATSELSESCKKTVTFNDNIKKRIFRLDSSIMGQRKKNQKRRDLKQRALVRRLSEGDSADYEDNNNNSHNNNNKNNDNKKATHNDQFYEAKEQNKSGTKSSKKDNNKSRLQHDSGVDLTNEKCHNEKQVDERKREGLDHDQERERERLESESSQDADNNKNSLMFEMDM